MGKIKDLTGMRFGKLLVLREVDRLLNEEQSCWECRCDCGNIKVVIGGSLRCGNTKSCGCLLTRGLNPEDSARHRLLRTYKRSALSRKLIWEITEQEFYNFIRGLCFYCGNAPSQMIQEKRGLIIYNGLDRIDNTIGYTLNNIVACCKNCNYAKRNLPQKEFIEMCKRIAENFKDLVF